MVDDERRSSGLSPDADGAGTDDFRRIIPPPSHPVNRAPGAGHPLRWKWTALGLGGALALTLLLAPIDGPIGSPFLRTFQHLTIPNPSRPTDRSLGGAATRGATSTTTHRFTVAVLGVQRSPHWLKLRVAMTNTGATPVLAEAGTTATLTADGQVISTVNPETSRNDFYTAINPGQSVTGWLAFPLAHRASEPLDLTIPHLFRLNTPLWTERVPVP